MPERTGYYRDGEPCWAELITADPTAAQNFYAALFGWTYMETGPELGNYTVCLLGGKPVAGLTPPPPGEPGAGSAWRIHLASSDVDALAALAGQKGGRVVTPPADRMMSSGRQVVLADPTGAVFGAWQASTHIGAGLVGAAGSVVWNSLTSSDGPVADEFYRDLFGYTQVQTGDGAAVDHAEWSLDGAKVCGRLAMGPGYPPGVPSHWMPYFGVADAGAAATATVAGGGKVEAGPFEAPPLGTVLILKDLTDAVCCVVQVSG
jgi:predicted enzyme related to lactoylglutathione lyase